jgi:hypothetical protein
MTAMRRFTDVKKLEPETVLPLPKDNTAVVEGRTLFPTRVKKSEEQARVLVSGKNSRKIGLKITKGPWKGMPIFTLTLEERKTCPRSCEQWRTCYGNNMQFARRHTHGIALENLLWLEVKKLTQAHGKIAVRLHVLGDFYSADYVKWWELMLLKFEGLHVFGFTAHPYHSEIGQGIHALNVLFPDRFAIRWSGLEARMGAVVLDHIPEGSREGTAFVCPAQTGKSDCCGTCGLCWSPTMKQRPVAFVLHGRKKPVGRKRAALKGQTDKRPWRESFRQVKEVPFKPNTRSDKSSITLVSSVKTGERFTWNANAHTKEISL